MIKRSHLLPLLMVSIASITLPLAAQEKSRVAILPFTAVEVPESEARVVTSLFETAMVKTDVYNVIEQNQISEILEAQAFSLSGCTDDTCAVEVGKLLAAELIIIGELSRVGGRYIANAKMIDVALGKNVNADSVSARDVGEMTDSAINLLAYKLAGLTYTRGGGEAIAEAFGEIFIQTDPRGAEIFVNGMRRGTSPMVVTRIPLGRVSITASKDNLSGEEVVELETPDLVEVNIKLEVSLGRLFIKSSEQDVDVYLDGLSRGSLGSGLLKDIPAGEHEVELRGDGLYWSGSAVVEAGTTVTLEAWPRAFGTLEYSIPSGVVGTVSGRMTDVEVEGSGRLDLSVGTYALTVIGDNYELWTREFSLERGRMFELSPELSFTQEYISMKTEEERAEAYAELREEFDSIEPGEPRYVRNYLYRLEKFLITFDENVYDFPDFRVEIVEKIVEADRKLYELKLSQLDAVFRESERETDELISQIESYEKDLAGAKTDYPYLADEARNLLVEAVGRKLDEIDSSIVELERKAGGRMAAKITSFGIGAAGFILSGLCYYLGQEELAVYNDAFASSAAVESREKLELYSLLQAGGLVAGGVGSLAGFLVPNTKRQIAGLKAEQAQTAAYLGQLKLSEKLYVWGIFPVNGGRTIESKPLLDWENIDGAESYFIRTALSEEGLSGVTSVKIDESEYLYNNELMMGDEFWWQVGIKEKTGDNILWSAAFSCKRELILGDRFAGGIVFHLDGSGAGLLCSESDQSSGIQWGGNKITPVGGTSTRVGGGAYNTTKIVEKLGNGSYAAKLCYDLVINGYDDWYLPSKDELDLMYDNLNTQGLGGFVPDLYWSSSEFSSDYDYAMGQHFSDGGQGIAKKVLPVSVRAVRAFTY